MYTFSFHTTMFLPAQKPASPEAWSAFVNGSCFDSGSAVTGTPSKLIARRITERSFQLLVVGRQRGRVVLVDRALGVVSRHERPDLASEPAADSSLPAAARQRS